MLRPSMTRVMTELPTRGLRHAAQGRGGGNLHSRVREGPPPRPGTGREGRGEGEAEGEDGGGVEPTPSEPSAMFGFPGVSLEGLSATLRGRSA